MLNLHLVAAHQERGRLQEAEEVTVHGAELAGGIQAGEELCAPQQRDRGHGHEVLGMVRASNFHEHGLRRKLVACNVPMQFVIAAGSVNFMALE